MTHDETQVDIAGDRGLPTWSAVHVCERVCVREREREKERQYLCIYVFMTKPSLVRPHMSKLLATSAAFLHTHYTCVYVCVSACVCEIEGDSMHVFMTTPSPLRP